MPRLTTAQRPIRSALSHASFRRLLLALAVSQAGDWIYNLALLAVVYDRTHSAAWVALTTAARVVPVVIVGPIGGVVAARCDRRLLMVASDVARMAVMLALAVVVVADLPILLAPTLAAVATVAASPYPSCVAAATPGLVPEQALAGANAARAAVGTSCIVAGPGLGALLLLLGSPAAAFLANAATFAVSGALVLTLPRTAQASRDGAEIVRQGVWSDICSGGRALADAPEALRLVGADVMCSMVYGAHTVLLLLLARELGAGAVGYGWLVAAAGAGGLVGTAVAGRVASADWQRSLLAAAGLVVAAPAVLLGATPHLPGGMAWAVASSALVGLGCVVIEVSADTSLQRCLPAEVLARAYGLAFPAAIAGIAAGSVVAVPLVSAFGLPGALVVVGTAMGAYVVLATSSAGPDGSSERSSVRSPLGTEA